MPEIKIKGHLVKYDTDDEEEVESHSWTFNKGYAETKINGKTVSMHRLLTDAPKGKIVDHLNGDGLDNRKENLRITTVQGNSFNRRAHTNNPLGIRGVKITSNGRYLAYIRVDGKTYNLGTYDKALEASEVYEAMRDFRNKVHEFT